MDENSRSRYAPINKRRRPLPGTNISSVNSLNFEDIDSSDQPTIISSAQHVYEVLRNFDERKKDIVRSIGFSGLLSVSRFTELDPKFTMWLMSKIRWNTQSIHLADKFSLVMRPDHIGKIIGIPYSGIEVSDKAFENEDDRMSFMKLSLSFLGNESDLLEASEVYLHRDLPFGFSREQAHRFKVAFVIFVIGRFLAPSLDTSIARSDFWGALKNPDAIHSFNWSSFVLCDILEAARKVVWDTLRNKKISVILGCPLIVQIFYLDSIDLGHLNVPHDSIPRVKHFNSALLTKMVEADFDAEESSPTQPTYGRTKLLRTDNICYNMQESVSNIPQSRGPVDTPQPRSAHTLLSNHIPHPRASNVSCKQPTIENNFSKSTSNLLPSNHHNDIDFPDFTVIMRDFFQGQADAGLLECFRFHQAMCLQHLTKFVNGLKAAITRENIFLVAKVVNHQRRSNGLAPINLELTRPSVTRRTYDEMLSGAESGDEITPGPNLSKYASRLDCFQTHGSHKVSPAQRPFTCPKTDHGSSSETLSGQNKSMCAAVRPIGRLPMSSLSPASDKKTFEGGNLGVCILSAGKGPVSNVKSSETFVDAEYSNHTVEKKIVQPGRLAVPHWQRNIDHPIRDVALTHSFFDWLSTTNSRDLNRPWIMHDLPRFIQLTGQQLKEHFNDVKPMTYDAFDVCVRRIRQLDKSICPKDVHLRWRHLLESDFSMLVLGGENPSNNVSIRHQFVSTLLDYELERCRMFFIPVYVDGLWWCYAWDLKSLTLTINDPSVGEESDALVIHKHAGTIQLLNKYLTETILNFYSGWTPMFHHCNIVVFRTMDMPIERSKSAFFTLFFIKNFTGTNLVTNSSKVNALQFFKEYMLYETLELQDNCVNPPSVYIHSIDD